MIIGIALLIFFGFFLVWDDLNTRKRFKDKIIIKGYFKHNGKKYICKEDRDSVFIPECNSCCPDRSQPFAENTLDKLKYLNPELKNELQNSSELQSKSHDCLQCYVDVDERAWHMVLCPNCGNKRCPKALNHRFKCTNSNEVDQVGELEEE